MLLLLITKQTNLSTPPLNPWRQLSFFTQIKECYSNNGGQTYLTRLVIFKIQYIEMLFFKAALLGLFITAGFLQPAPNVLGQVRFDS